MSEPPAPEHRGLQMRTSPPVFFTSAALLVVFLLYGVLAPSHASAIFSTLLLTVSTYFGWIYVVAIAFFIFGALALLVSPYARLRLGADDERPEFSTFTWFAMLFSAGMGIGLVFYGVAEPMLHLMTPPSGEGNTAAAAHRAMGLTLFHWGIHAWAIYVLMALGIAYFSFRKGLPLAIRSCLHPLLGEHIHGWPGHLVDIFAVFGTLFGLATSLGLGAMQVSAGLHYLFGWPHDTTTQLILIAVITLCATVSLVTGVNHGIRRLSELNIALAALLLTFVFVVGPTGYILSTLGSTVGDYAAVLIDRTFATQMSRPAEAKWMRSWTIFYWGWWIAWAPFVGMFVARVSRGRTIREFILAVLLVPTLVTLVWFSVFGGTALDLQLVAHRGIGAAVENDVSTAIYVVLSDLPLSSLTSLLAAVVVAVFFVTSSDSASFVVDMLTSGGHPNPPIWQRIFWATAEGACAAVLLYAGGKQALQALQAAVVSIGLPFCLVLVATMVSLVIALREEPRPL